MIRFRRRRPAPADIPRDERLIAVGSLSGLPPADIAGYVLIACDGNSVISVTGDQCCHGRTLLLASAIRQAAAEVAASHGRHP